ncbi:MAG: hypothetical protein IPM64_03365 [Phycisphaerales bacterium]|nr:hypothetical protein [Phycisphaerales bacterium]
MRDAIPTAQIATPWELVGEVWEGEVVDAIASLGEDGAMWLERGARVVRLAKYVHRDDARQQLTLRAFEFADAAAARDACAAARPAGADGYDCADGGFWSDGGVTYQLGEHVIEVFGNDDDPRTQFAAAYLAGIVAARAADEPGR